MINILLFGGPLHNRLFEQIEDKTKMYIYYIKEGHSYVLELVDNDTGIDIYTYVRTSLFDFEKNIRLFVFKELVTPK